MPLRVNEREMGHFIPKMGLETRKGVGVGKDAIEFFVKVYQPRKLSS